MFVFLVVLLGSVAGSDLSSRVAAVLGSKTATQMQHIEVELPDQGVKITG